MDAAQTYIAPRTCTVVDEGDSERGAKSTAAPLIEYSSASAYVLIAEPGAGKTTAFKTEAARQSAKYVTVREFRTFDKPEWRDTTLFLDGLDEARAGTEDGRTSLDDVRRKLHDLGRPAFRLSCRWADWMAATDRDRLKEVAPEGAVTVMRLEPLSKQNIKDILTYKCGVEDADGFIAAARERGVDKLLTNPQNLDLLAKSVLEGKWPDSERETFEQACRMLAREPNGEHLAANPSAGDIDPLIEAAGWLCAAQLLSGGAGYTLPDRAEPDGDYPSITEVDVEARSRARQALGTRLFEGISEGRLAPAHRQIAEFLAARHVSELIDDGLPPGRILALITGFDGELVPSFMNFASWLAVHNKRSRKALSRLDASGLIYAGDRDTYTIDEKQDILLNLRRESSWNPWCARTLSKVPGIGGIVSPELEGIFREILAEQRRDHEHQSYVMLLMQMLADGEPLPALSNTLGEAVHDRTWNWGVRCAALDVLIAYHSRGSCGPEALVKMLGEIDEGSLDDPADGLFSLLLRALYPGVLSIGEVQAYLRAPKLTDRIGEYAGFWTRHVPKESTPDQLAELLDGIAKRFEEYRPFLVGQAGSYSELGHLPMKLLTEVLRATRGNVSTDRLYDWLGAVSDPGLRVPEGDKFRVKFDLEWNREALKDLIVFGVETCLRTGEDCMGLVDRRLFGARPFDFGRWYLEMALDAEDGRAASFYLRELVDSIDDGARTDGLTVEAARAVLAADDSLLQRFDEMRSPPVSQVIQPEHAEIPVSPTDTDDQRAWQARIMAEAEALCAGGGPPQLLRQAAEVYLDIRGDAAGKTPRERLGELVGGRIDLIDLLIAGIEGTVTRDDLPSCDHTVRLFDKNWIEWPVLPFVAGLHSLEQSGRLAIGDLGESQLRLAVTLLYMLPGRVIDPSSRTAGEDVYRPGWFRDLLREDPTLVADVISRSAAHKLDTGVQPAVEIRELTVAEDHREVATIASLPVLESFPAAETDSVLTALCWSLRAALKNCDWSDVSRVIERRLRMTGQGPGERACWLTAGYVLDPERYRESFQDVANEDVGLKWLSRFVAVAHIWKDFTRRFAAHDFEPFVVALGAALRRFGLSEKAFWRGIIYRVTQSPPISGRGFLQGSAISSSGVPS